MAQVQGEEIYLSHSGQEVDDNIDEVVAARGDSASLSARLSAIVGDFEADQQRQETEIGAVAAQGAKNLLKITASSQTIKGVTFTVNDDQTVTVNGTNDGTGASTFVIVPNAQAITIPDGNYILSGCPSGGGGDVASAPFDLRWYMYSPGKSAYDSGNGASIEKSGNTTSSNIAIVVKNGQTADNLTFKPMLRPASIVDDMFVPYAKTNRELTIKEQVNENNIAWNTNNGVKNLINNTAAASTENAGITWTKNADGSMTGNGTCTGTSGVRIVGTQGVHTYAAAKAIPKGTYVVAPTGKTRPNERFTLYLWSNSEATPQTVTIDTSAYEFSVTNDTTKYDFSVGFSGSNVQITNDTLYPMICLKSLYDSDNSYQPYALPNPVLTPALIEQVDNGAKNLLRNTASSQVVGGVTFTVNADGTISANGTKTNNDWLYISTGNSLAAGTYVLSSGLTPQSNMSIRLLIATADSLGSAIMSTEGARQVDIKQLTSDYTGLYYAIRISSGTTVNNVVFKPMLCTAADYAISPAFVPYCPTNRELYETKITLADVFGTGKLIPDNADLDAYTIIGKYYGGNSAGNTVLHLPVENGSFTFSLEVRQATPSMTYQYLRICRLADDPYIYIRRKYTTWGTWYRFTGEAVASAQSAASLMQAGRIDAELTDAGTDESKEEER